MGCGIIFIGMEQPHILDNQFTYTCFAVYNSYGYNVIVSHTQESHLTM